jgi:alpha-glucosidase
VAKYNSLEHNKFPVLWAQVVREAIDMAESVEGSDKILSFSRAGYRESPKYSKNFWVGDQLQTWDGYSGMKSALMGMLTGSVSGFTLIHGDIGGYVTLPVPGVKRTEEMLVRWIQLMAFSSCMRTHEGTLPQNVVQAYSNEDLLKTLKKYGEVFVALSETRRKIVEEATNFGIPLMRPMYLEFSESKDIYKVEEQFMYGDKIMVTPVLVEDAYSIHVYFPKIDPERRNNSPDIWVNLVSGEEFTSCDCFQKVNVTIADIPVFVPKGQANEFDFLKILYRPMM